MAFDFSKLNFFSRLDARARVFVLFAGLLGVILLIYFTTRLLSGPERAVGPSRVATAPNIQSVPGGKLTPEYYQALMQANKQAAQQAQISGTSAVPTLYNIGNPQTTNGNCIICSDQSANVKNDLDDWVRKGEVSPDVASALEQLAAQNVPVGQYADALQKLVKEGKLTPEQARQLLADYEKQHANALLQDSANQMDGLIKSGALPLDVANQLLADQKKGMSPSQYAAELRRLVAEGKISPEVAQALLAQYTKQRAQEVIKESIVVLNRMTSQGQITPDVEKDLISLENQMVPLDQFSTAVQQYVTAGRLTPAVANSIIKEYNQQKTEIGPSGTIQQALQQALTDAYSEISDLLKNGQITQDVAAELTDMIQKQVPLADFQATLTQLVKEKKLTPKIAALKFADYQKVSQLRTLANTLGALQANNASPTDYADELKKEVAAGLLTPAQAAELMKEYQASQATPTTAPVTVAPGNEAFAQLAQRAQGTTAPNSVPTANDFNVPPAPAVVAVPTESEADRAARIQALTSAMSSQAQQLVASWLPPVQVYRVRSVSTTTTASSATASSSASALAASAMGGGVPLIKAGSILFAVLDTTVNSDYADSPVLATIVAGPFKGAKLLGKLNTVKSVSGQLDRITLNFTLMNEDSWPASRSVTAYAIDPDTAKADLATSVNYHYFLRFGAIMATSFLQGFANAITTSGSTSTTGIFGTSTTHPVLGTAQNIWVGLGQIGQTLGNATQNYIQTPPTVKIASGVGIGILFMQDVT